MGDDTKENLRLLSNVVVFVLFLWVLVGWFIPWLVTIIRHAWDAAAPAVQ